VTAEVTHDPTSIAFQLFQCLAHALELFCMGIATNLQRQSRRKAGVGLPQFHPGLLRQGDQLIACPLVKPGVRRIGDILFHHGGIHRHALGAVLIDRAGFLPGQDCLGQQPLHALFADALAPTRQRRWVNWQLVLEKGLTAEVLVIGIFDPAGDYRLVRQPIGMLEVEQPRDQARRRGRSAFARWKEPRPFPLEHLPVDQGCKLHQLVPRVDHVDQSRTQQIILFGRARTVLHGQNQNCRVSPQIIQNPAGHGEKKRGFSS
jgi:hypothetical protein